MKNPMPKPEPSKADCSPSPLATMRSALDAAETVYDVSDDGEFLSARFNLTNVEVRAMMWGEPDELAVIILALPIRVPKAARLLIGEFLHRANYDAARPVWEMDFRDGEIRLRTAADTRLGPLTGEHFWAMLGFLLRAADTFFPFICAVMTRAMKPEIALDQAEAAYAEAAAESGGEGDDATAEHSAGE